MLTFMLGVLGSVLFWCIFIPINFIITIMVMKSLYPWFLYPFTENKGIFETKRDEESYIASLLLILLTMIFWPLVIIVVVMYKSCCVVFPIIGKILGKTMNVIPAIKIEKKE